MENAAIDNPRLLFDSLDSKLREMDIVMNIVVCGGIVLQMVHNSIRATHDIDSLTALDDYVKEAVAEVGSTYLGESQNASGWLNDDAIKWFDFDRSLPSGWEDRALDQPPIYSGEYLSVYPLARRDLTLTKLFGIFSRPAWEIEKDIKDLKIMGVSAEEIFEACGDLRGLMKNTRWEKSEEEVRRVLGEYWQV